MNESQKAFLASFLLGKAYGSIVHILNLDLSAERKVKRFQQLEQELQKDINKTYYASHAQDEVSEL